MKINLLKRSGINLQTFLIIYEVTISKFNVTYIVEVTSFFIKHLIGVGWVEKIKIFSVT